MALENQSASFSQLLTSIITHYLLVITLMVSVFWMVQFLWGRRKLYKFAYTIRGPPAYPIIGNTFFLWNTDSDFLTTTDEIVRDYKDDIVKLWLGTNLCLLIQKPECIELIVNNPNALDKPYFLGSFREVLGEGLITSSGSKWRRHRRILSLAFNMKQMMSHVAVFYEEAQHLVEILESYNGENTIEKIFVDHSLNVATRTLMGLDLNKTKVDPLLMDAATGFFELAYYRTHLIYFHSDIVWNMSPSGKKMKQYADVINKITNGVIKSKHQKKQTTEVEHIDEEFSSKFRKDLLDTILETKEFTQMEIQDELNTFLLAASDTSAEGVTRALMFLGMYPEIQQQVYDEVMDVIGKDGEINFQILKKLDLVERVVKETMRILPTVNVIVRETKADINVGNHILPEGAVVLIYIRGLHRNPKYWKNPLKFDPDRFLPEEENKRHTYNYMPFSLGNRMCIGYNFALNNIKTILATLIREFKVTTGYKSLDEIVLRDLISSKLVSGARLKFERR